MPANPHGNRGQTSLDFLIGVGVFMLTVAFVIGAIPGLIDPFATDQEHPLVADRVTSEVVGGMFADPDRASVLNETCTYAFFNSSLGSGSDCAMSYDATEDDLPTRLGIDDTYSVNITVQRNVTGDQSLDTLCTVGDGIGACADYPDDDRTVLSAGPAPPDLQSVVSTRRSAFLDGKDVTVVVKVW